MQFSVHVERDQVFSILNSIRSDIHLQCSVTSPVKVLTALLNTYTLLHCSDAMITWDSHFASFTNFYSASW